MLFSSTTFLLLFLPIMLLGYHVVFRGMRRAQNLFLLVGSLFFYAWGEPWFVLVMLGSILVNYGLGLLAHKVQREHWYPEGILLAAFLVNLSVLFIFKYLTFTLDNLSLLGFQPIIPVIRLPIGISFFTFQALSYVIDVAKRQAPVQRDPLYVGLYISFFPQLIAGPIVKYADIAYQIDHRQDSWADFSAGCSRFLVGLGKKVLLSNQLALVADRAFALGGGELPAAFAWLGALCYTLQIYYDFSGYSDMAIGLGSMFGFRFLENFRYPYFSRSITDFWRRWHISLSSWFRDYVYIPLGGSRTGKTVRNLLIVWLLTGLWHGANWTFIAWGLFYFVLLTLEKFRGLGRDWPAWAQWAFTFLMVNFGWVLFRADTLGEGWSFLLAMFGTNGWISPAAGLFLRENLWVLTASLLFMVPFAPWCKQKLDVVRGKPVAILGFWAAVCSSLVLTGLLLACLCYLIKGTYNPFIYFNF